MFKEEKERNRARELEQAFFGDGASCVRRVPKRVTAAEPRDEQFEEARGLICLLRPTFLNDWKNG